MKNESDNKVVVDPHSFFKFIVFFFSVELFQNQYTCKKSETKLRGFHAGYDVHCKEFLEQDWKRQD